MRKTGYYLLLLGCLGGCTQLIEHAAYVAPEDAPPPPKVVSLQFDETAEASAPENFLLRTRHLGKTEIPLTDFYQFSARPGQTVTITLVSKGGDTSLLLWDSIGHSNGKLIAQTTSWRPNEAARAARLRGDHSELILTLPPDEDGVYYIQPSSAQHGYSLTLKSGAVPSQDILQ